MTRLRAGPAARSLKELDRGGLAPPRTQSPGPPLAGGWWQHAGMPTAAELTLDCADAERMPAFWKVAVGYIDEPTPSPFATRAEWLAALGEPVGDRIGGTWLVDAAGVAPPLSLIEVPEPKTAKNRAHGPAGLRSRHAGRAVAAGQH